MTAITDGTASVRVEYRILSRRPGKTVWAFRAFTGSRPRDLETAARVVERAEIDSPGWSFKIETRTVTIIESPWVPV